MGYHFYGHGQTGVAPVSDEYAAVRNPDVLYDLGIATK